MSNLGLERFLTARGLRIERTKVGDRYVVEAMRRGGWNLGGEQSGHVVMTDYATTGDGLLAGLQVLAEMKRTRARASEVLRQFEPVPQVLDKVAFRAGTRPLEVAGVKALIEAHAARLQGSGRGRILIRPSGTEPVIRVMAECEDAPEARAVVSEIMAAIEAAAG
jgi:phosphoglucosamine mutase